MVASLTLRRSTPPTPPGAGGSGAATVVAFAVPGVVGGGQASASWTPTPEKLTGAEIVSVGDACVIQWMLNNDTDSGFGGTPVLAERRGDWSYVALSDGARLHFHLRPSERGYRRRP